MIPRRVGGALSELLACLVGAAWRTRLEYVDRVARVGLGYIGLGMLQLVSDPDPEL